MDLRWRERPTSHAPLIGTEAHRWPVHLLPQATSSKALISNREAPLRRLNKGIADATATGRLIIRGYDQSKALLSIGDHQA
jgi:hypothetical protein